MNYKNIYQNIIDKRKTQVPDIYTETHHILPRSLGGSDEQENLVKLTAREHFICHYLLAKMYEKETIEWYKMNNAFLMMKCESIGQKRYFNSRLYEALRKNFSSLMSVIQTGKNNSQYGTMWISNIELKESKKIRKSDNIPEGWIKGRNVWNRFYCKICGIYSDRNKYCSDECRDIYYKSLKGKEGIIHTNETKNKMSSKAKKRKKILCVWCNTYYDPGNYSKSHGDKCKHKA